MTIFHVSRWLTLVCPKVKAKQQTMKLFQFSGAPQRWHSKSCLSAKQIVKILYGNFWCNGCLRYSARGISVQSPMSGKVFQSNDDGTGLELSKCAGRLVSPCGRSSPLARSPTMGWSTMISKTSSREMREYQWVLFFILGGNSWIKKSWQDFLV